MQLLFLGTSSTLGFPREGCRCPQCRSRDPKDHRTRSAALINREILIDAGPDILAQLQREKISPQQIKIVFLTHRHQDASGGLKKLKAQNPQLKVVSPRAQKIKFNSVRIQSFRVPHARIPTVGFLISSISSPQKTICYISDTKNLKRSVKYLRQAKIAVIDGSGWETTYPSHITIKEAIPVLKPLKNLQKIYFTHNGHTHIPHRKLVQKIRRLADKRFDVAYDGLKIEV